MKGWPWQATCPNDGKEAIFDTSLRTPMHSPIRRGASISTPSGVMKPNLLGGENRQLNLFLCMNKHLQHRCLYSSIQVCLSTYQHMHQARILRYFATTLDSFKVNPNIIQGPQALSYNPNPLYSQTPPYPIGCPPTKCNRSTAALSLSPETVSPTQALMRLCTRTQENNS